MRVLSFIVWFWMDLKVSGDLRVLKSWINGRDVKGLAVNDFLRT